jgi:hypothetical protein
MYEGIKLIKLNDNDLNASNYGYPASADSRLPEFQRRQV